MLKQHKLINSLPSTLEPDSIYYVKIAGEIITYVTNSGGNIVAYPLAGGGAPTGSISSFLGNTTPGGYLIMDGSEYNKTEYPLLYQFLVGNSIPNIEGSVSTKFIIPDARGKALVGKTASGTANTLASKGGNLDLTFNIAEFNGTTDEGATTPGANGLLPIVPMAQSQAHDHNFTIPAHDTNTKQAPYFAVNFIIKT